MPTMTELDALEELGWDTYEGHTPAPSEHAPRKETIQIDGGMTVQEVLPGGVPNPDAWVYIERPVEVRR